MPSAISVRRTGILIGTAVSFAIFLVLGVGSSVLGPTIDGISRTLAVSAAVIGFVRAGRQVGQFLASVVMVRYLDRARLADTIALGCAIFCAGFVLLVGIPGIATALVGSLLWGIGHGLMNLGPTVLVGRIYQKSSIAISLLHVVYGTGGTVGPLLVLYLAPAYGWQGSYVLLAALTAGIGLFALSMRSKPYSVPATTTSAGGTVIAWRALAAPSIAIFCFNGVNAGITDWLYTQAVLVAHATPLEAAGMASLYWACITAGRLLVLPFLHWFGDSAVLGGCGCGAIIGVALIVLAGEDPISLAVLVAVLGLSFAPIYPVVIAHEGNRFPAARGSVTSKLTAVATLGAVSIPLAQAWVAGGTSGGFQVTAVFTVILTLALFAVMKQRGKVSFDG